MVNYEEEALLSMHNDIMFINIMYKHISANKSPPSQIKRHKKSDLKENIIRLSLILFFITI